MQESVEQELAHRAIEAAGLTKTKRGVKRGSKRTNRPARTIPSGLSADDIMLTMIETQVYFGGPGRPIHSSTLYRGIANGLYPRPVWIGANSVRWLLSECREARQRMINARDKAA